MNVTQKARNAVFDRDGGMCMHCGSMYGLTIQHRQNRGMGGDKAGKRNNMANLITLCNESNTLLEADAVFAARGIRNGWKLRTGFTDIDTPVLHKGVGQWWLLNNDGGFHAIGTEAF